MDQELRRTGSQENRARGSEDLRISGSQDLRISESGDGRESRKAGKEKEPRDDRHAAEEEHQARTECAPAPRS
jgi:hypothetical protein